MRPHLLQPVAYALAGNSTECWKMKSLLIKVINRIEAMAFKPLIKTCDQGGPMWSLLKTNLRVTVEKPFFFVAETKLFAMPDPSHHLKIIRNNLRTLNEEIFYRLSKELLDHHKFGVYYRKHWYSEKNM